MAKIKQSVWISIKQRVKKCASIPINKWPLSITFALLSACIKVFLKLIPFHWIAPYIGKNMQQDFTQPNKEQARVINQVSKIIEQASCFEPWTDNCLNHALLGKYLLKRRNIPSTLHLGVCKSEKKDRPIDAHAWLTVGSQMVCGQSKKDYTFLTCFK